ncbi:MAG: hypothetical protein ACLGQX_04605, partial [Acidobacteriota bacterium]
MNRLTHPFVPSPKKKNQVDSVVRTFGSDLDHPGSFILESGAKESQILSLPLSILLRGYRIRRPWRKRERRSPKARSRTAPGRLS